MAKDRPVLIDDEEKGYEIEIMPSLLYWKRYLLPNLQRFSAR